MRTRDDAVARAIASQGRPYRWGALDCSGLVVEALDVPDGTAAELATRWELHPISEPPPVGALIYYGPPWISHVMLVAGIWPGGERWLVGACGGGPGTTTEAAAALDGAIVRAATYSGYRRAERVGWNDPWS
jgi:hypothetical protein